VANNSFLLGVLLMMVLRIRWLLPAAILLALHFIVGLPMVFFWAALGAWILYVLFSIALGIIAGNCNSIPRNQKGLELHPGRTAHFDEMYKRREKQES
jgi:hypothetical protein